MGSLLFVIIILNVNMLNKLKALMMKLIKNCVKNVEGKWCKNLVEMGCF